MKIKRKKINQEKVTRMNNNTNKIIHKIKIKIKNHKIQEANNYQRREAIPITRTTTTTTEINNQRDNQVHTEIHLHHQRIKDQLRAKYHQL